MTRVLHLAVLAIFYFGLQQQYGASAAMDPLSAIKALLLVRDNIDYVTEKITGDAPENDKIDKASIQMLNKLNKADRDSTLFKEQLMAKVSKDVASKLTVLTQPLLDKMDVVNIQYKKFMRMMRNLEKFNNLTVAEFANVITSHSLSELDVVVEQMHTILTRNQIDGETILTLLSEGTDHKLMCGKNQTAQMLINELYKTIVNLDLKSVAIRLLAFGIKEKNNGNSSFGFERKELIRDYKKRVNESFVYVERAMQKASRDLWRCDPPASRKSQPFPNHKKGVTFSTLNAIFQSQLIYERDMDKTCYDQCDQYENRWNRCESDYCKNEKRNCKLGSIVKCMDMSDRIEFCSAAPGSERAYEWAKTDNGLEYGRDLDSCGNKTREVTWEYPETGEAAPGPWSPLKHCNWCLCTCADEHKDQPRYFSLRKVVANEFDEDGISYDNKVITGAQIVLEKNIYQIRIQTATLGPNATLLDTPKWKDLYDDSSRLEDYKTIPQNDSLLFSVSWYHRTVHLDERDGRRHNKLLTGLRFGRTEDGKNLRMGMELSTYNYASGALENSHWFYGRGEEKDRQPVSLSDSDDPLRHVNNAVYSKSPSYVQFQTTSIEKDMGQLTVPFVDTQEVVSDPPVPFHGAGLFVRGTEGSGGFLALKLIQYDLSSRQ